MGHRVIVWRGCGLRRIDSETMEEIVRAVIEKMRRMDRTGPKTGYATPPQVAPGGSLAPPPHVEGHEEGGYDVIDVTTTIIHDLAITTAKIQDLAVENAKIANLAVTEAKIGNLAVTNAKIANMAVTNAKIANLAVDSAKIATAAITSAKIATAAVGTLQIANLAVTTGKCAELLGIRSAEIPVVDPKEYFLNDDSGDWSDWEDWPSETIFFSTFADIKHNLEQCRLQALKNFPGHDMEVRVRYSTNAGSSWNTYDQEQTVSATDWTYYIFTESLTTGFNTPLWIKPQARVKLGVGQPCTGYIRNFELNQRAFLGRRLDV